MGCHHLEAGAVLLQRRGRPSSCCKCLAPQECTLPGVRGRGPAGRHDYEFEYYLCPKLYKEKSPRHRLLITFKLLSFNFYCYFSGITESNGFPHSIKHRKQETPPSHPLLPQPRSPSKYCSLGPLTCPQGRGC